MEGRAPLPEITSAQRFTPEQIRLANKAALETTPRHITITDFPSDIIELVFIACQGKDCGQQEQVANLMKTTSKDMAHPIFAFIGDIVYPDGVTTCVDPRLDRHHSLYPDKPSWVVLGNHDTAYNDTRSLWGRFAIEKVPLAKHFIEVNPNEQGIPERNLIAHSMLISNSAAFPTLSEHNIESASDEISYDQISNFFIPHLFYSVTIGKVIFCVLNTNTYVKDYLEMLDDLSHGREVNPNNQAFWLKKLYEKAEREGKTIIQLQHHPLRVWDKRTYEKGFDAKHYLNETELTQITEILKLSPESPNFLKDVRTILDNDYEHIKKVHNANHDAILYDIMIHFQKIEKINCLCGHSHNMNYTKTDALCQVNSAGGGEKLQPQINFTNPEYLGCFFDKHGCAVLTINKNFPEKFDIQFHTIDNQTLKFTSDSPEPVQEDCDESVEVIKYIVRASCLEYENFLNNVQEAYHGKLFSSYTKAEEYFKSYFFSGSAKPTASDVALLHEIKNFVNQPVLPPYNTFLDQLANHMQNLSDKTNTKSLYVLINRNLVSVLHCDIDTLLQQSHPDNNTRSNFVDNIGTPRPQW